MLSGQEVNAWFDKIVYVKRYAICWLQSVNAKEEQTADPTSKFEKISGSIQGRTYGRIDVHHQVQWNYQNCASSQNSFDNIETIEWF